MAAYPLIASFNYRVKSTMDIMFFYKWNEIIRPKKVLMDSALLRNAVLYADM